MSKWQPISTAPKDGSTILTYAKGATEPVAIGSYWEPTDKRENTSWRDDGSDPTHWMPLPSPPSEQRQ